MRLLAISDLHVRHAENREALMRLRGRPDDWLILGGDLGETEEHLRFGLDTLRDRFARLIWIPGNHELYTAGEPPILRGVERYQHLVEICRERGVLTPEDPYPIWNGPGGPIVLAPLFLLYDYSFRPDDVPLDRAIAWAAEDGIRCTDEKLLDSTPYNSKADWCTARVADAERRLLALGDVPTILINHYPLREDQVRLWRIPRFSLWCGTKKTHDWHLRFHARVVVYGHLHIPRTEWLDGVRFEEVSFGYPRQRPDWLNLEDCVRQILPEPELFPFARTLRRDAGETSPMSKP